MGATSASRTRPDPFTAAADIFDPPPWEPAERAKLEPHQVPPEGEWALWLLEGGRGSGKTEACARYFASYMRANPGHRGRIIAPTFGDAVEACIRGPSGLKSIDPEVRWVPGADGGSKVFWPNGSEALVFGVSSLRDVERFRAGGNRHLDWWEEMAANAYLREAWDQAQFGLRLGRHPHSIGSTTPRNVTAYKEIRTQPGTVRTHATLFDNPHNPREWIEAMRRRYEGTTLGLQELSGQLIEDIEGALWKREWIDSGRVGFAPEAGFRRSVLALDPADGLEDGDEQAWCLAGAGNDHHLYVVESVGMRTTPTEWLTAAVNRARRAKAVIVVEKNHGGAFLVELLEQVMANMGVRVPYVEVSASEGKTTRAEPAAMLYEQGAATGSHVVHHIGGLPELEDQMVTWTGAPGEKSPDRLDALVWALAELSDPVPQREVVIEVG